MIIIRMKIELNEKRLSVAAHNGHCSPISDIFFQCAITRNEVQRERSYIIPSIERYSTDQTTIIFAIIIDVYRANY